MPKGKVLVTPRSGVNPPHPALEKISLAGYELLLGESAVPVSLDYQLKHIDGLVGYLAGVEEISAEFLRSARDLRVISRNGVGVDAVALEEARLLNIPVLTTPGANSQGVAELAIALLFETARNISSMATDFRLGKWHRIPGVELYGKTLGVIGCGEIGKRVAKIALGLGMKVVAFDAYPDATFRPDGNFSFADFEEVIKAAEFLTLHCPPAEKPIIGFKELALMPEGAVLINTARFGLVDLESVHQGLESGKLSKVAFDAFEPEPPTEHKVFSHSHFIGTPHVGGYTRESVDRAMHKAVDNLLGVLES